MYHYDASLAQSKGDPWRRYGEPKLIGHLGGCLVHYQVFPPYEQKKVTELMYKLGEFKMVRIPVVSFPIRTSNIYRHTHIDNIVS